MYDIVVQAVYFGLHCSAREVTTFWLKQPFCVYSALGMTLALGMVHGKLKKKKCGTSFILSVMPIHIQLKFLYGHSTCDITTVTRILLSISQFQATEQKVHTYAQQSLAYRAHQNMHIWYMKTLTIFVAKASPNCCSSIEQVSPRVNSTQEF